MKNITVSRIFSLLLVILVSFSQSGANAFLLHSAKSKSTVLQERLDGNLPAFRYDRNNIELNHKTPIDLILKPDAMTVTVEVTGADAAGLAIDETTLLMNGLKIFKPKELRLAENQDQNKNPKSRFATFNLSKAKNQTLLIEAVDFTVLKVFVKGFLPGSYTVKATIDGVDSAETIVFTRPDFRLDAVTPTTITPGVETTLTLLGMGLDALTRVGFSNGDVEIKDLVGLDDATLKVTAFVASMTPNGYRDVSISSPLLGRSVILTNGLLINDPALDTNGLSIDEIISQGTLVMNGSDGMDGMDGEGGMGVCADPNASLTLFINSTPVGSMATIFFDPIFVTLLLVYQLAPQEIQEMMDQMEQTFVV